MEHMRKVSFHWAMLKTERQFSASKMQAAKILWSTFLGIFRGFATVRYLEHLNNPQMIPNYAFFMVILPYKSNP